MSAVAGWYPDPNGTAGQLRWWDGAQWTDHVTPDPDVARQATSAAQPSTADVPAATEPEVAATPDVPVAAGWGSGTTTGATDAPAWTQGTVPAPTTPAASSWGSAGGGAPGASAWQAPPRPSSNGVRIGLIVAAVIAVVLVAIVGVAFMGLVGLRSSFSDFAVELGSEEGFGGGFDWDGEVVAGEPVTLGGTADGSVPDGGIYEFELVVPSSGAVTIDVRTDGFDAVAQIRDDAGTTIAENDDRGGFSSGGDSFDPLIQVHLEPGTYRVQVRGFAGDFGDFEARTS